jgi:hypothetical protein
LTGLSFLSKTLHVEHFRELWRFDAVAERGGKL